MVGYVTLGSNDLDRAIAFYDALLETLSMKQIMNDGRMVVWASDMGKGMLAVCKPYDEQTATVGNGVMVALNAGSAEAVAAVHARALELGASDEGAPGLRGGMGHFGYFRDHDGNKLCAFHIGA
ncbi:MAG: VOC family protein [Myxococcota bacterium]